LNSELGFHYINGELCCDGVSVCGIAERVGTPCYVYSAELLRARYGWIRDAFAQWNALVCFSVKSLGNLAVLRLLADCGSGFDVVSGGELHRVISAGGSPSKTVYAGVGKTAAEIRYALQSGVRMLNVESPGELRQITEVAGELGSKPSVAIRVNPDVNPHTHEKTTTGTKESKFGVSISGTLELVEQSRGWDHVDIRGIHVHLGSPIYSAEPYEQALAKIVDLIGALRSHGCDVDTVNIGGGYPISYTGEEVPGPEEYASAVERFLENLACEVIIEPGRYISGPSGLLLVRVLYRKESQHGKKFVVCDGGMSELIRPTLYGSFHRIWPARSPKGMPEVMRQDDRSYSGFESETVDVVGPICESGDSLAEHRALPAIGQQEVLAVFDAGAYGFTMSSNYNGRPRPAEVLVDAGAAGVVRRRETYEDLIAAERTSLPPAALQGSASSAKPLGGQSTAGRACL